MKIHVFGPGCLKCQALERNVKEALALCGVEARVIKIDDPLEIAAHGINRTPAVSIDGHLKLQGRAATVQELCGWIGR